MSQKFIYCFECSSRFDFDDRLSFRAECPQCSADLHICRNCHFWDEGAYNECKEPSADRVIDKTKNNVCEYFRPSLSEPHKKKSREELLKKAHSLFKKA